MKRPYVVVAGGRCIPMDSLMSSGEFVFMPGYTYGARVSQIMDQVVFFDDVISTPPEEIVPLTWTGEYAS